MKAIKRTVAALLATLMLATSTSFTLAAETYTDDEAVVVAKVNAAGIMTGTDKGFEPSKSLTRAEAAAIIVRMKGISESAVKTMAGTTLFNDVAASHWASGYVNEASNLGIVKGVSAKEFAPDREVTVAEFVTMAIRALGAGQLVDSEGVWPTNYVNFANDNDLLKDVTAIYTATASRMNAATIVANTLEATIWEKSGVKSNGEITWSKNSNGRTILDSVLNIVKNENVYVEDIDTKDRKLTLVFFKGTADEEKVSKEVADGVDMSTLRETTEYDAWYDKDDKEIVGIWKSEDSKTTEVAFTEIVKATTSAGKITLKVDGKDKEYTFKDVTVPAAYKAQVHFNNAGGADYDAGSLITDTASKDVFGTIILDGSKISELYAYAYTNYGIVKEVKNDKVKFETKDIKGYRCSTLDIDEDDYEYVVTKDGKDSKMSNLKAGDVIFYYEDDYLTTDNKWVVKVLTDSVEGKVTSVSTNYVKVDGKKYNFAGDLTEAKFNAGDKIVAYLNEAGCIVMFEKVAAEDNSEYAVIKKLEATFSSKGKVNAEVTLVGLDGAELDTMELDLDENYDAFRENDELIVEHVVDGTDVAYTAVNAAKGTAFTNLASNDGSTVYEFDSKYYLDKDDIADADIKALIFKSLFGTATALAETSTYVTTVNGQAANTKALGALIKYDVVGGKLVINEFAGTITASDDDTLAEVASATELKVAKVTKWSSYEFTDSTKVLVVKKDKATKVKVSVVDVEDIDTCTVAGFVGEIDDDEIGIAVLYDDTTLWGSSVEKVVEEKSFAAIVAKEKSSNEDFKYAYEVVFQGSNEVKTYYSDESLDLYNVYELNISGEEITGTENNREAVATGKVFAEITTVKEKLYTLPVLATGSCYAIEDILSNDTFKYGVSDGSEYTYKAKATLADEVIYIAIDADDEYDYSVGRSISEIEYEDDSTLATYKDILNDGDYSQIVRMVGYADEDNNLEVVAIVFVK